MDRDCDERLLYIERTTREACAALRTIFEAKNLDDELERIGLAEDLLAQLREQLDELERESA